MNDASRSTCGRTGRARSRENAQEAGRTRQRFGTPGSGLGAQGSVNQEEITHFIMTAKLERFSSSSPSSCNTHKEAHGYGEPLEFVEATCGPEGRNNRKRGPETPTRGIEQGHRKSGKAVASTSKAERRPGQRKAERTLSDCRLVT